VHATISFALGARSPLGEEQLTAMSTPAFRAMIDFPRVIETKPGPLIAASIGA
jgi:hypothetical protein